jgi:MFS family permease
MPTSSRALRSYSEWLDPRFRQLLLFQMAFGYAYSALLLVPKFATVTLGASPSEVGTLAACPVVASFLCAPLCGVWLDRGGHRRAMITGSLALAVSVAPFGYLHEIGPLVYALRLLHGLGNTLIVGGAAVYVARLVPAGHHGRAFGTAGAASLMMNALASSATERLADAFGWGLAYQVAGAISLVMLGLALWQPAVAERCDAAPVSGSDQRVARRRAAGIATVAAGAGFGMLVTFTQPYAIARGATHVASLFVGYTTTALLVRLGLGGAVDRWGRQRAALVALSIYALTVALASALGPGTLFVLGLGFGVAHGLAWPALTALAVENAPVGRVGSALTHTQALFAAGTMLAVWIGGQLVSAYGYPLAFVMLGWAVAGGAVALRSPRSA